MTSHTPIVVKKFGGTSVGSVERIQAVAERVVADMKRGEKPVVVASAMSGETNRLVDLGEKIFAHHRGPAYDMLVASGEQVSIALVAMAIEKLGFRAKPYLSYQLGILTDSSFSKARIQKINSDILLKDLEMGVIPVVAGFQGVDKEDNITTLGRGGSDTSAVALAAALSGLDRRVDCEIFTDVPAVFTADPRLVPKAKEIPKLSFEEMMEMASLGSKVLHIRCVEIGANHGVRIHVRTSFEPREGTWVVPEGEVMENPVVSAVTHDSKIAVIKLVPVPVGTSQLAQLFEELSRKSIIVDIITQSLTKEGQELSFSVSQEDFPHATKVISQLWPQIKLQSAQDVAKLSIVGVGMRNHPGVAARFFRTLATRNIPIQLVTTSEIKVSAVIPQDRLQEAAQALHADFGLDAN